MAKWPTLLDSCDDGRVRALVALRARVLEAVDVALHRLDELDHPPPQVMRLSASEVATAGKVMMALR